MTTFGQPQVAPKYVLWNNYFACNMCNELNAVPFIWCDHIKDSIAKSHDAGWLHPGMTINVPIMPEAEIWAEVHISQDTLPGGIARMEMVYKPEFANLKKVDLGFWNPGEGLWVMRTCIVDYIKSRLSIDEQVTRETPMITPCPSQATHNLSAIRWMNRCHTDIGVKWKCLWNIVMEGACTYCVQLSSDPSMSGLGSTSATVGAAWNPTDLPQQCREPVVGSWPPFERCAYPKGHSGEHRA